MIKIEERQELSGIPAVCSSLKQSGSSSIFKEALRQKKNNELVRVTL